ncbi:MAG: CotH kinase family protein [Clostridia bacterium]|nr:CotH kinase family protein [Clostridia bacterium]
MLRHNNIDRICCIVLALTLLLSTLFVGAAAGGVIAEDKSMGYENRLFDQSYVHTIDIVMSDWDAFLDTATSEEYSACHLVIDGESFRNVAIRGKGNTSLSSVASYGNDRYSFKVEFDHYQSGSTYYGLDKLSLNNLIYDNTYMKDYFAYTLMSRMGVAASLCSFVQISVNGEYWGLYLAVEGVEDAFLQRNYGKDYGELYKPDSMSFGGGRGNGGGFDMNELMEQFGTTEDGESGFTMPDMSSFNDMGSMQPPEGFDPTQMMGGTSSSATETPTDADTPVMPGGTMPDMGSMQPPEGFDPMQMMGGNFEMPDDFDVTRMRGGFGGQGRGMSMGSDDVKLQYIDDDPSSYANIFNNAKTEVTEADQTRLIASLKALNAGDISVIDTDAVIRYMAVHNFLCNDDSYTGMMVHNYYLYEEDGVLTMIPWDYNLAYGTMSSSNASSAINTDIDNLVSNGGGDRPLADWITASEEHTAQYHAIYGEFVRSAFDSGWFASEIDRVIAMISPYVESDPTAFCTYEEFLTAAETLKTFCLKRAESVINQLNGDASTVDTSELDLSAMGSMNQGMGGRGGFERSGAEFSRHGRTDDGNSFPAIPTGEENDEMPAMPTKDTTVETPGISMDNDEAPSKQTSSATTEAPSVIPAEGPAEASGSGKSDRSHPSFDTAGMNRQGNSADGWICLATCAALLCAALIFVKCYRTNR